MENYLDLGEVIQRLSDGAFIPKDEANKDYQQYLIDTNGE
jgi:hypothetical protein